MYWRKILRFLATRKGKTSNKQPIIVMNQYVNDSIVINQIIDAGNQENAFYVCDLGNIVQKYRMWKTVLPRVEPHYAVKCNDHPAVLTVIAALGMGFDCASKNEINKILEINVDPCRIIYAHPTKPLSHIQHAANVKVTLATFDNEMELYKLKRMHPTIRAIIRIRYDSEAYCRLGSKFGCDPTTEAFELLQKAKALGINVVGVSFHVGSGCKEPLAFYGAIKASRNVFDDASTLGYSFSILDIGGGYPGEQDTDLLEFASVINSALEEFFPQKEIRVIAEPGTYFVASAFTLVCNIHSLKKSEENHETFFTYYINDGVYGSFGDIIYYNDKKVPRPLNAKLNAKTYRSSVWGPTCDSVDRIISDIYLPEMEINDWLVFSNMGAYTLSTASSFNGFDPPDVYAFINNNNWYKRLPFALPTCIDFLLHVCRNKCSERKVLQMALEIHLAVIPMDKCNINGEIDAPVKDTVLKEDLNRYAKHCTIINDIIELEQQENAFFVCDLNAIIQRHILWKRAMPRIMPHYAVKCNDHTIVLKVLAALGICFDCASIGEINKVLSLGVDRSRIIFANTTKPLSHIRYAAKVNVDLITFDNEAELHKLQQLFPKVRAVIRIRYDAKSFASLGSKFGCNPETEAPCLLRKARSLGINVVGVCFHVGSSCYEPSSFYGAIKAAKRIFDFAATLGYNFNLLDIGGGFTTRHHHSIFEYAKYVNTAIADFFPEESVRVISEPGTYFVESAFTLACNIHSIKKRVTDGSNTQIMYYINDGVFGSFLIRMVDEDIKIPQPLKKYPHSKIYPSVIWGPTMDSTDIIVSDILLPEMEIGDWLVFSNMGDYTVCVFTYFNSFEAPEIYNIINRTNWRLLSNTQPFKSDDFTRTISSSDFCLLSKKERSYESQIGRK